VGIRLAADPLRDPGRHPRAHGEPRVPRRVRRSGFRVAACPSRGAKAMPSDSGFESEGLPDFRAGDRRAGRLEAEAGPEGRARVHSDPCVSRIPRALQRGFRDEPILLATAVPCRARCGLRDLSGGRAGDLRRSLEQMQRRGPADIRVPIHAQARQHRDSAASPRSHVGGVPAGVRAVHAGEHPRSTTRRPTRSSLTS
jgi:hypothetical protein